MSGVWIDESSQAGTQWLVYQTNGKNILHLVKSQYGVPTGNYGRSYEWCYFYPGGASMWIPMEAVTTVEEAKALALVLWRMGE